MQHSDYDAWLVDLDGTLYRPKLIKLLMAAELLLTGAWHIPLLRRFRKEHEKMREESSTTNAPLISSTTPFDQQVQRTALATTKAEESVRTVVMDWMVQRPAKWLGWAKRQALLDEIAAFRTRGGRTALVSDYPARVKLEALGATPLFDAVIANGEHPELLQLKPQPDGYLLAARALGVPPEKCLVIGDRDDADGGAAQQAGMGFRKV